jgi:hypothetical protein
MPGRARAASPILWHHVDSIPLDDLVPIQRLAGGYPNVRLRRKADIDARPGEGLVCDPQQPTPRRLRKRPGSPYSAGSAHPPEGAPSRLAHQTSVE